MSNSTDLRTIADLICSAKHYTLIDLIAEGGFKQTFHVRRPDGVDLALKLIKPGNDTIRLDREIEAMRQCHHPHIGTLVDFDNYTYNGYKYNYIVEPYASGGSLLDRLQLSGTLERNELINMAIPLSSAIGYLSEQKLVHRDIKPDNIMFLKDPNEPILLDFGIVRNLEITSLTQTFHIRGPGTPYYAAPEQLNNQKELIDWRTDQYALGMTLAKCIYSIHPHSEPNEQDPMQGIERVSQYYKASTEFIDHCTREKLLPLLKMIEPFPIYRFPDAISLINAWKGI